MSTLPRYHKIANHSGITMYNLSVFDWITLLEKEWINNSYLKDIDDKDIAKYNIKYEVKKNPLYEE